MRVAFGLRRPRFTIPLLAALLAVATAGSRASAQTSGTLTGTVTGDAGQPLANAQVSIVGTGLGSVTNDAGKYTIVNIPAAQYRARAQMIGHRPMEQAVTITAGGTATQNFVLKTQVIALDEVVVTGTAGAARQREVGNAVSQIDLNKIAEPPANVGALLQGRATGMTVTQSSASAGSGSMIRLRGNVSVAMSNQPLIYVDGVRLRSDGYAKNVPFTGSDLRSGNDVASPMNDINPADIERIEIIKGAAAATLYGTEAAAGVIQIFTKSGRAGKPQWSVSVDQGFVHSLPFGPDMSAAPPSDTIPKVYRDSFPDRFADLPARGVSRAGGTSRYLFIDPWLRNGQQRHYTVSVAGGGEALRYFASGGTTNDDGVLPLDNEAKRIFRGNFSFTPLANLLFAWNTSYTQDHISNTPAGNNAHGLTLNAFRRDRNYASDDRPEVVNKLLNQNIDSYINHLVTGGSVNWSPSVSFSNKFTIGFDRAEIENRNYRPFGFVSAPQGILSDQFDSYNTLTLDYAGNLARQLMKDLRGTFSWGGQGVTTDNRETAAYGENFPGPGNPVVASAGTTLGGEKRQRVVNAGGFGQVVLDLKNRYFLTGGLRIDGNSAFGKNLGLQTYPKLSASWVASEEPFWPAALIPEMKFRAAWGQSGRAPGAFDAVRTWENANGTGWGGQPAFFPLNVGNPDLGPERTSEIEMGFDGAMWGDRVSTQFTYFRRDITDALFNARQIPSLGFLNSQLQNVGTMASSGIELTTNVVALRRNNFEWTVGGSIYTNSSEVKSLGGAADFSLGTDAWIMKGQPIPVIRSDNQCVVNPEAHADPVFSKDPAKECIYGPNLPSHTYGLNTGFDLPKGIRISARGEYEGGHFMYDGAGFNAVQRSVRWPGCYSYYSLVENGHAADTRALDRVRCEPSKTRSDYWVYPSNYAKLRDVSISIPVPARYISGASSASITLAGHNIWKWVDKDFPVFDPETGNNGGFDSKVRSILEHVPPPALYMMSLHITF